MFGGLVICGAGVYSGFFVENGVKDRVLVAEQRLTRIFQQHGHGVTWESVSYTALHPYLKENVQKGNWDINRDYSSVMARNLSPMSFIHVLTLADAPRGGLLFLFLFEDPVPPDRKKMRSLTDAVTGSPVPLIEHQHASSWHYYVGQAITWGDLSAFPLERYFPFEEINGRESWVREAQEVTRKTLLWRLGMGGACFFAGAVFLGRNLPGRVSVAIGALLKRAGSLFRRRREVAASVLQGSPLAGQSGAKRDASVARKEPLQRDPLFLAKERAEQNALHEEIEALYHSATGGAREKILRILSDFPGNERVRLNKARGLLQQARMACGAGRAYVIISSAPRAPRVTTSVHTGKEKQGGGLRNDTSVTNSRVSSLRWLIGLFADMESYIKAEGGDPFVVGCVVMLGFMRPTKRIPFMAGGYGPL